VFTDSNTKVQRKQRTGKAATINKLQQVTKERK
jgi:hypothetical protein